MIWLIVLAVIVLLAFMPLSLSARWNARGSYLKLRVGPVRVYLDSDWDPVGTKKRKRSASVTAAVHDHPEEETGGLLSQLLPQLGDQLYVLNELRKKLWVKRLDVKLILAGEDPCDLAMNYGKAQAGMYGLIPLLEQCFTIRRRNLKIECDFDAAETVLLARAELRITLIRFLGVCWRYARRSMQENTKTENSSKGGTSL